MTNNQPTDSSQAARLAEALAELIKVAEDYLEWNDQNWSNEADRRQWRRLRETTDAARQALVDK